MVELEFYDAPPPQRPRGAVPGAEPILTAEVREALRARPGKWTKIHESSSNGTVRRWRRVYGPQGFAFEIRTAGKMKTRNGRTTTKLEFWASYQG